MYKVKIQTIKICCTETQRQNKLLYSFLNITIKSYLIVKIYFHLWWQKINSCTKWATQLSGIGKKIIQFVFLYGTNDLPDWTHWPLNYKKVTFFVPCLFLGTMVLIHSILNPRITFGGTCQYNNRILSQYATRHVNVT